MAHASVPAAEEILDVQFPVLDHGFVRLVDYMGSDDRIVQAARVSYGEGTTTFRKDKALINYLLRNGHTSPFEQVVLTFHVKMPIFVARQWIRHRTARLNEISGRYSIMDEECYVPDPDAVSLQSTDNKQGRSKESIPPEVSSEIREQFSQEQHRAYRTYRELVDRGIARELARINLPLSLYTQWYWQIDLHNLFHFLKLRLDSHAQLEIRKYAQILLDITRKVCPSACEAFEEHILYGRNFSRTETEALKQMLEGGECPLKGRAREIFLEKLNR